MSPRSLALVAAALAAVFLAPEGARADAVFEIKTRQLDNTIESIDRLVKSIEAQRAEAAAKGQAMRASCIDVQLKGARENLAVARSVRKLWAAAESDMDYRERMMTRILRLQVYAMVFEDETRRCTDAGNVVKALEVSHSGPAHTDVDTDAPPAPRLERPPLCSPF